jgi:hypothetical protein
LWPVAFSIEVFNAPRQNHHGLQRLQESQLLHDEEQATAPRAGGVEEVLPTLQLPQAA